MKKELPEFFVIKSDLNNPLWEKYINWLNDNHNTDVNGVLINYYYGLFENIGGKKADFSSNPRNSEIISLEYWNEYIDEPKEIIGYKFKPEFESFSLAAASIANYNHRFDIESELLKDSDLNFDEKSIIPILKKAGVLDLWFEPVYEQRQKSFINGHRLKMTENGPKIGCTTFNYDFLNTFLSLKSNIDVKDKYGNDVFEILNKFLENELSN